MTDKEDDRGSLKRAEEFLQLFKKGAEFTQELLKENERLRYQLLQTQGAAEVDDQPVSASIEVAALRQRILDLEQEKLEIHERIQQVEAENLDFANRYVEIEAENNQLANLYIASYQLHSTLDFAEVLQVISEIIINLIGAEQFAIMLLDQKTGRLQAVTAEGLELEKLPAVVLGQGVLGRVALGGENHFIDDIESYRIDLENPLVAIPLKIKEHVIGVIVIYGLLVQKQRFAEVDYELFTLLAGHAATAIFSSNLYSESERKLSTIQGFIGLLTK
ncbi:MAG: GAF domain-containing protein [Trichloromonadaceae bacterium]